MKIESTPCRITHYACNCVLKRMRKLEETLRFLLLSADCSWEEHNEGHDWHVACRLAREVLEEAAGDVME